MMRYLSIALLTITGLAGLAVGETKPEFMVEVNLCFGGRDGNEKLAQEVALPVAGAKEFFIQGSREILFLNPRFVGPSGETPVTEDPPRDEKAMSFIRLQPCSEYQKEGKVPGFQICGHSPDTVRIPVPEGATVFKCRAVLGGWFQHQMGRPKEKKHFLRRFQHRGYRQQGLLYIASSLPAVQAYLLSETPDLDTCSAVLQECVRNPETTQQAEVMREYLKILRDMRYFSRKNDRYRKQAFNASALITAADRDPLDITVRRVRALLDDLNKDGQFALFAKFDAQLKGFEAQAKRIAIADRVARFETYKKLAALRREIAFSNPLVKEVQKLLFITRPGLPNSEGWGSHMCDQFFGTRATLRGRKFGGLFVLDNPFSLNAQPKPVNLLKGVTVQSGANKGKTLDKGGFLSPEVSFDGKQILFAWTQGTHADRHRPDREPLGSFFHIYKVNADGSNLEQLTTGKHNDFDPCWLPNGRIVFISERRGGYGRCHGRPVPSYTLHSMYDDGTDIVIFSPHETNEWQPSVGRNGMILYTRWDYVDRGFNQAHHAWITYPDGRDARAINGNTRTHSGGAPFMQMDVRQIPGSPLLISTAAPHHGEAQGSLIAIDPRVPDDDGMSAVRRITPEQPMPEAEGGGRSNPYSTPWPLSENYTIAAYEPYADGRKFDYLRTNRAIYLVDAFGNKDLIYRNPAIGCSSPMPLQPRVKPPVIPHATAVGKPRGLDGKKPVPLAKADIPKTGTVGVMNVYDNQYGMPKGEKIVKLRIMQILPKYTPHFDRPNISHGANKGAKQVLGTVPVEEDGSAFWIQPAGIPVLYQALNAKGEIVQGMRSAAYVQPGERQMCNGCHESRHSTPKRVTPPKAIMRAPSKITPSKFPGAKPFSYPLLVQPVLDKHCVACHTKNKSKAPDLSKGDYTKDRYKWYSSYKNLRPYISYYNSNSFTPAKTLPWRYGAPWCKLYKMLKDGKHHNLKLPPDDLARLMLWMDTNAQFFGHEIDVQGQSDGKVVWPAFD